GDRAPEVIKWAFEVQDRVRAEAKTDKTAAARIVKEKFPELAACVGSAEARSKLNKSMRWAVSHNIRVLTPQLFVDNVKLCDEDVDLGLEYALSRMLAAHDRGERLGPPPAEAPPPESPMGGHHDGSGSAAEKPKTVKPAETKPAETKPAETGSAETKPAETKPAETGSAETKPAETKTEEPKPDQPVTKPNEPMPPEEKAGSGGAP
ncbi:MAG: hypothetical protein ABI175_26145, partial [Polyangiales bacterium]